MLWFALDVYSNIPSQVLESGARQHAGSRCRQAAGGFSQAGARAPVRVRLLYPICRQLDRARPIAPTLDVNPRQMFIRAATSGSEIGEWTKYHKKFARV